MPFSSRLPCLKKALFFTIDDIVLNKKVLFAAVYIEPHNSDYFDRNAYQKLEESILQFDHEHICLLGDFNSRTGGLPDTFPINEYSDASVDIVEFDKGNRTSKDTITNTMGHELLRFCKKCHIFIVNGRVGRDKGVGKLTCKDASVVDYALLSYDMFDTVIDFKVLDFDEMISDVHCAININFKLEPELGDEKRERLYT